MKYFIDCEFIEGFSKWTFAKNRHFIDLISIGIVAEDGRTYYAISNEFNPSDADEWVKENVLYSIMLDNGYLKTLSNLHGCLSYSKSAVKQIQKDVGKSNKQIVDEIKAFCDPKIFLHNNAEPELEFYGYYSDYDWVLFCSLFGRMIDLPTGFPMYCNDLKQTLDEKLNAVTNSDFFTKFHIEKQMTLDEKLIEIKRHTQYPKQNNEHDALSDAKWNYELYKFLCNL